MNHSFIFLILLLISCGNKTSKSVDGISICANPITGNSCIEILHDRIYYSNKAEFDDSIQNFESTNVSRINQPKFNEIIKLVLSSDLMNGQVGEDYIGEKRYCIRIDYSDGTRQDFEKVSLTSKDYRVFEDIMAYTDRTSYVDFEYKIKTVDCALFRVPEEIQQPMKISVPEDSIIKK